jgi:hypothetical protein
MSVMCKCHGCPAVIPNLTPECFVQQPSGKRPYCWECRMGLDELPFSQKVSRPVLVSTFVSASLLLCTVVVVLGVVFL